MHRQLLIKLLKVCVSACLIIFLLYRIGVSSLLTTIGSANFFYLLLAFSMVVFGIVISAYKWRLLLAVLDIHIELPTLLSYYFVSMFWRNFLSTIGGEAIKIYYVSKHSGRTVESFTSVFLERGTGLFALLLISVVTLIFGKDVDVDVGVALVIVVLFTGYLVFLLAWFNGYLFERSMRLFGLLKSIFPIHKIRELRESVCMYKTHKKCLVKTLAISLVFQILSVITAAYVISLSLGLRIPLPYFFLFCPIIGMLSMLPISLNGIGVREGAYLFFFTKIGVSDAQSVSMSLIIYAMALVVSLIGGVVYAIKK